MARSTTRRRRPPAAKAPLATPDEKPVYPPPLVKGAPRRPYRWACQPGTVNVRQLVEGARAGDFRIPSFQRDLVWDEPAVLHLLDSLRSGYYIGSLLYWERYDIGEHVPTIRGVPPSGPHGYLVVDGQQRIDAITRALSSGYYFYDVQEDCFLAGVYEASPRYYPLDYMRQFAGKTLDWIKDGGDLEAISGLMDDLLYREIATVRLPHKWGVEEVVEMFRRINTAGVPLTLDEVGGALERCLSAPSIVAEP